MRKAEARNCAACNCAAHAGPGGNITGLSNMAVDLTAKRFEFLMLVVPARRLAEPARAHDLWTRPMGRQSRTTHPRSASSAATSSAASFP
jgi:hypothetical protein